MKGLIVWLIKIIVIGVIVYLIATWVILPMFEKKSDTTTKDTASAQELIKEQLGDDAIHKYVPVSLWDDTLGVDDTTDLTTPVA